VKLSRSNTACGISRGAATIALAISIVTNAAAQQASDVVSLDRVRAALAHPPPKLSTSIDRPPERKPDFSIVITDRARFERLLPSILDFDTRITPLDAPTGAGWTQPIVSVDLLSIGTGLRKAYARGAARREVRGIIAEYCAAQPNDGSGILICDIRVGRR
jgi:hypothetical protein